MLASIIRLVQLWHRMRRACRELDTLNARDLEDVGLCPYEVVRRRKAY